MCWRYWTGANLKKVPIDLSHTHSRVHPCLFVVCSKISGAENRRPILILFSSIIINILRILWDFKLFFPSFVILCLFFINFVLRKLQIRERKLWNVGKFCINTRPPSHSLTLHTLHTCTHPQHITRWHINRLYIARAKWKKTEPKRCNT